MSPTTPTAINDILEGEPTSEGPKHFFLVLPQSGALRLFHEGSYGAVRWGTATYGLYHPPREFPLVEHRIGSAGTAYYVDISSVDSPQIWGTIGDPSTSANLAIGSEATALNVSETPSGTDVSRFVEVPDGPGKRHEPVIKGKGVPIWSLIAYVEKRGLTPIEVSQLWNGYITAEEVAAAVTYKRLNPDSVDDRLDEQAPVAP